MVPQQHSQALAQGGKVNRIRTINECLRLIKVQDPGTSLTYNGLRKLVEELEVKHVKAGNRYLINYDDLLEKLLI